MGKDILVFIFSTTLLIILLVFCTILCLGEFLTVDNITKTIKNSDFSSIYKNSEINSSLKLLLDIKIFFKSFCFNINSYNIINIIG